jgi:hypothetical protein
MKRRIPTVAALAALAAAGVLAALTLAPAAAAYTWDQLPGLGYSINVVNHSNGCHDVSAGYGSASKTSLGSDCDSDFQARLDAFVAATCPCAQPATTTTTTATTTTTSTTTDAATTASSTTTAAATTTEQASPAPAPSTPNMTTAAAAPTAPADDQSVSDLTARVSALEQQVADLTARIDALVQGQTVTFAARTWKVASAKHGLATLVATKKKPGEKAKPKRRLPSTALVPLLKGKTAKGGR